MLAWAELKALCDDGFSVEIEFRPGERNIEEAEGYFQVGMRTVITGIRIDTNKDGADREADICVHLTLDPSYHLIHNTLFESKTYYSSVRFDCIRSTQDELSFANAFDDRARKALILGWLDEPDVFFRVLDVFDPKDLNRSYSSAGLSLN